MRLPEDQSRLGRQLIGTRRNLRSTLPSTALAFGCFPMPVLGADCKKLLINTITQHSPPS
ncbi:hypothetical protein HO173_013013 [Letharia columbiana]|uniref:Uncharacterized protein n=1 Tax=Letharia columbiana TaxID=112416 RepID=A0A8H6CJC8_9LECA|nr:uncharacterized protein HO173_013013 [Letharia columbiana]KAF6224573.1 hypothetical protein HO173_013013 [Letharia columbiana]